MFESAVAVSLTPHRQLDVYVSWCVCRGGGGGEWVAKTERQRYLAISDRKYCNTHAHTHTHRHTHRQTFCRVVSCGHEEHARTYKAAQLLVAKRFRSIVGSLPGAIAQLAEENGSAWQGFAFASIRLTSKANLRAKRTDTVSVGNFWTACANLAEVHPYPLTHYFLA